MQDARLGPNARLTIDLERQVIVRPNGEEIAFEIDPFRKHLLLNGLDDIGQTLQHAAAIDGYEARDARPSGTGCLGASLRPAGEVGCRNDAIEQEAASAAGRRHRPRGDARGPPRHRLDGPPPPLSFDISEDLVGGAAIDARGTPITDATMQAPSDADAILFGAVGGPKWDTLGFDLRPEIAILRLRGELGLFANLRPAIVFDALLDASTLKPDIVRGLDLMIVRESTGGIYFGKPRGIENLPDGSKRGVNTEVYTTRRDRARGARRVRSGAQAAGARLLASRRRT